MILLNQLLFHENYLEEGQGIYFWLETPYREEQRQWVADKLPKHVKPLFDKMQLDCPENIVQLPVVMRGQLGILVSYSFSGKDVEALCAGSSMRLSGKERAMFEWLKDIAAVAEVSDFDETVMIGFGTWFGKNEICLFIPEKRCVSREQMGEISDKLAEFVNRERKRVCHVTTPSGRLILFRTADAEKLSLAILSCEMKEKEFMKGKEQTHAAD